MTAEPRLDDWANNLSRLGGAKDKSTGVRFSRRRRLQRDELEAMYEQNPIVGRAVDRLAQDALRNGWRIKDIDADVDLQAVESKLEDLSIDPLLKQATQWSRLYGGAAITLPVFDKRPADQPIDFANIERFSPPAVIDAYDVLPHEQDGAFLSPTYRQILSYQVTGLATTTIKVHHSRLIPFEAIKLPVEALMKSGAETGWGPSVIERLYDELAKDGAAAKHAIAMMYVSSVMWIKMAGYRKMLSADDGVGQVRELLGNLRAQMDTLGLLGLDAGDKQGMNADEVGVVERSLAGAHELLSRMRERVAAAADMPKEILFNESPAGLNAGELSGPQEIWFAYVASYQKDVLTPAINRILEVAFAAWGIKAAKWTIEWEPLWTRNEKSEAETSKLNAETDQIYHLMGAAEAEEIRKHRFVDGKRSALEIEDDPDEPDLDLEGSAAAEESGGPSPAAQELVAIIEKVHAGALPRDSAAAIIRATLPQHAANVEALLGSAGVGVDPPAANVAPPETDTAPTDLMSPRDAGERFGVPTVAMTRAVRSGEIRHWQIGSHIRVSLSEVEQWSRRTTQPEAVA